MLFATAHLLDPKAVTAAWMAKNDGWQLDAFSGFGAMSGFALASLGLVASLMSHDRARQVLDANPGRYMLRTLVHSMWAWLVPAILALASLLVDSGVAQALFIAAMPVAAGFALRALYALTLFFRRFTRPRD